MVVTAVLFLLGAACVAAGAIFGGRRVAEDGTQNIAYYNDMVANQHASDVLSAWLVRHGAGLLRLKEYEKAKDAAIYAKMFADNGSALQLLSEIPARAAQTKSNDDAETTSSGPVADAADFIRRGDILQARLSLIEASRKNPDDEKIAALLREIERQNSNATNPNKVDDRPYASVIENERHREEEGRKNAEMEMKRSQQETLLPQFDREYSAARTAEFMSGCRRAEQMYRKIIEKYSPTLPEQIFAVRESLSACASK